MAARKGKNGPFDDLGPAGQALVADIVNRLEEHDLQPDPKESHLLHQAGRTADRIAELEQRLDAEGFTIGEGSGLRAHPLLAEERQTRLLLSRLLAGISIVDSSGAPVKSARHQAAANVRWAKEARRG